MLKRAAAFALLALAACKKPAPDPGPAPSASGPAPLDSSLVSPYPPETPPEAPPPPSASAAAIPPAPAESRRASVTRVEDERLVAPYRDMLRDHFGGAIPSPLELQVVSLTGDRSAVLAYGEPRQRHPFLMALDEKGTLLWSKERPLAGTRQVVTEMVLAPGPRGELSMLWCDIPTQIVGLRRWIAEGTPLGDFEVMEVDLCEALSALYWPARGWIAVASQHGAARAQLLTESGKRAWGPRGAELPWTARPSSPATIAVDSDVSAILFQVGDLPSQSLGAPLGQAELRPQTPGATDHVLAMRFDTLGTALWPRPLDLGPAPPNPPAPRPPSRISATRVDTGKVRVSLGKVNAVVTSSAMILGAR